VPISRLSNLGDQVREVFISLGEQLLATRFSTNGILRQLGSGQASRLDDPVELIR
jgi:hypothetical protein